jgi:gamma-tubulin complex component 3
MDFTDKREGDLDALIAAHRAYLDRVVRKILLLGSKRDKQVSHYSLFVAQAGLTYQEIVLDYVREALDICLKFRDVTVSLPSTTVISLRLTTRMTSTHTL